MARFTGFVCDRHDCTTTAPGSGKDQNQTPFGWPRVNILVDGEVTARDGEMVFCGNACALLYFGTRLVELDDGNITRTLRAGGLVTKPVRGGTGARSDEARANMALGQLRSAHAKGAHDNDPRPACPLCEATTTKEQAQ